MSIIDWIHRREQDGMRQKALSHQGPGSANLVEVSKVMLHTKYQGSRHCGFRQEGVFVFSLYISLCKTCDPRAVPFLAPGA